MREDDTWPFFAIQVKMTESLARHSGIILLWMPAYAKMMMVFI